MKDKYVILVAPLSAEDGGGFVGIVPDLPGCISDGETYDEAAKNTCDAIEEWLDAFCETNPGKEPPMPGSRAREFHSALQGEREKMATTIAKLQAINDKYDERLDGLADTLSDLSERLDALEAWVRFDNLIGEGKFSARATDADLFDRAAAKCN